MIRGLIVWLFSLALSVADDSADAVRKVAEGWYGAAVKQDAAALNQFLADDLSYTHAGGKVQTKSEYIASVMTGPPHYESMTYSDMKIRGYGNTPVLTAHADVKLVNSALSGVRTLRLYVVTDAQWRTG